MRQEPGSCGSSGTEMRKSTNAASSKKENSRPHAAVAPPTRISVMTEPSKYSALEQLRDGRRLEIRAMKPTDEEDMLAAVDRTSAQSLYRRFFGAKRHFSESEKAFFLKVDFLDHVALVAVAEDAGRRFIVGGGRYVVVRPDTAEVAFAVIDDYQGQGIGAALLRHLVLLARNAGIKQLIAEVLPENIPMLKVFQKSGLGLQTKRHAGVVDVTLNIANDVTRSVQ
jgi:GNAT superfamily N-acetyltransferase